jgi:hypothetical protein
MVISFSKFVFRVQRRHWQTISIYGKGRTGERDFGWMWLKRREIELEEFCDWENEGPQMNAEV